MSDAQRRAIRTLLQAISAAVLIGLYQAFAPAQYQLNVTQVAALTAILTPVVAFAQNWFEDNTNLPAVLKAPPSSGQNPTPDP